MPKQYNVETKARSRGLVVRAEAHDQEDVGSNPTVY